MGKDTNDPVFSVAGSSTSLCQLFPHRLPDADIPPLPEQGKGRRDQSAQNRPVSKAQPPQDTDGDSPAVEGQERSAVKVHPGGVIRIPVQMHLHPRIHKLAEIVGGKMVEQG